MIWVGGRIVPDDALKISVLDRTFEHGLGLFETFRTWNGHATLLGRHLARMTRSARELGLPLDPAMLPDAGAVKALASADGRSSDAMFRITLSGGLSEDGGETVWMRSARLPPPMGEDSGAVVEMVTSSHGGNDRLSRHKTLNYWPQRLAYEEARAIGADEAILFGLDGSAGLLQEGSRSNFFVVVGDATLVTPDLSAPILPGVMRAVVLDFARRTELAVEERAPEHFKPGGIPGTWIQARKVREAFLTNSVRGIIPVREMFSYTYPAPGPWTRRLWGEIRGWLESGGIDP